MVQNVPKQYTKERLGVLSISREYWRISRTL